MHDTQARQHPTATALAHSGGEALQAKLRALAQRPAALPVREVIDRYMRAYKGRDSSRAQRLAAWVALLGDFTLEQLDADLVHVAREELRAQPALAFKGTDFEGRPIFKAKRGSAAKTPATLNKYVAALGAVCTWAIEQRIAPRGWVHPCRGVRRLPEPDGRVRFLEPDERERLLAACKASKYPRLHAFVLMALLTGARRGELLALRWRDVELPAPEQPEAEGVAYLARSKNGDRKTLVLLPAVVAALRPFAGEADRYVFGSPRAKHREPASIDTAWREAVRRAGLSDFKLHDCRHDFASRMVQAGVDLVVVAECLGHRQLAMTKRYSHLKRATKAQAMRAALGECK
jgi:integrase